MINYDARISYNTIETHTLPKPPILQLICSEFELNDPMIKIQLPGYSAIPRVQIVN